MENCWELSHDLSLCMRRLSRLKEFSILERIEKSSKDALCPVLQIRSSIEEGLLSLASD